MEGAGNIDRGAIGSPSDEPGQLSPSKRTQGLQQEVEEGYHSVPPSGVALNIGYTNSRQTETLNVGSGGSFMTAFENPASPASRYSHQHDTFEEENPSFDEDPSMDLATKFQIMASEAGTMAYEKLLNKEAKRKLLVQACYLGIGAIFGTLLRLILAQAFGQSCNNPSTLGWVADESVLCVTRGGTATQYGGIVYADLPANLLGSFFLGLLQDGASLGLAVNLPIAFFQPSSSVQSWDIFHMALKIGFCGSLTTFGAWNSQMVLFLVTVPNRQTMVWRALLGYIIGIQTAIGSYVFGKTVAWWLHQWVNPELAKEQKAMNIRQTRHGIAINRELPLVERRYLHGISEKLQDDADLGDDSTAPLSPVALTQIELAPLHRWRESTREARRVESGISRTLVELETALISRREALTFEMKETAIRHGWDIDGLVEWLSKRQGGHVEPPSLSKASSTTASGVRQSLREEDTVWYNTPAAALLLGVFLSISVVLMVSLTVKTAQDVAFRTMAYSMLFATPGALLRWQLSSLNGKLGSLGPRFQTMAWLPIGTLTANVLAAMISISMIRWEFNIAMGGAGGFWGIATIRAFKIGFSGCLSTVSDFVAEVHSLMKIRLDRGYKYILITLSLSCALGIILFLIVT